MSIIVFNCLYVDFIHKLGERCGAVVERRTPEREVGIRNLLSPCCDLEQDTLLPESTGNTQEVVAPFRHNWKNVDWNVKP